MSAAAHPSAPSAASRRLAWCLCAVALLLVPTGPALLMAGGSGAVPFALSFGAVQISTALVGAVVASRLPGNVVGWLLLAMGASLGVSVTATAYGRLGVLTEYGPLPGDEIVFWLGGWTLTPIVFGGVIALVHLFPDGRLTSRRWRPVAWTTILLISSATVVDAFIPGPLEDAPQLDNPAGAPGRLGDFLVTAQGVIDPAALPIFGLAIAALVVRFRRSRGIERQQLKWISSSLILVAVGLGITAGAPGIAGESGFVLAIFALATMPVATGVAMLRYRLYDIDVVLNRALVYASLTATLGGLYVGAVLLLQLLLDPLTEGSSVAIALSTLTVAAVFRPVRGRIQSAVDRRFFRHRYDAVRILEAFGAQLRHQVDLVGTGERLAHVVGTTVEPSHISLWLPTREVAR